MTNCKICSQEIPEKYYYSHLYLDEQLLDCVYCNAQIRPKNYKNHIFTVHNVDWEDKEFAQMFFEHYGPAMEILYFIDIYYNR